MKFVYLRKNSNLSVLNMGYKLDLLQPKQEYFDTCHTADQRQIITEKFHLK